MFPLNLLFQLRQYRSIVSIPVGVVFHSSEKDYYTNKKISRLYKKIAIRKKFKI